MPRSFNALAQAFAESATKASAMAGSLAAVILGGYEIARLIALAVATSLEGQGRPSEPACPGSFLPMLFPIPIGWEECDFCKIT
jgi:hypothetical protein